MSTDRRGFTLIELLMVVTIIGILASVGIPNFKRVLLKARAAEAIGTLDAIQVALLNYQADYNDWPADVGRGTIPAGLDPYLPDNFTFNQPDYVVDYDDWSGKGQGFVGLTVITEEQDLGIAMLELLGPSNVWTNGTDRFAWVIEWTD